MYRLITWYGKLEKQQWLSVKVSMRWDVLWPTPRSIYVKADFKRLEMLSISKRWDYLSWECWGCWLVHKCPRPIHERSRSISRKWDYLSWECWSVHMCPTPIHEQSKSINELGCYWSSSNLHRYYKPDLELDKMKRLLDIITYYYMLW
jgi:hypothetical protein